MGATILAIIYLIVLFFMNKSFKKSLNEMQELYDSSTEVKKAQIRDLISLNETNLKLNSKLLEELKELKGKPND